MARTLRIGLSIHPDEPFWVQVREAAFLRAQQLGIDLIPIDRYDYVQHDPGQPNDRPLSSDQQTVLVEELLGQDFDALIGWEFPEHLAYRVLEAGLPIIHHIETTIRHPRSVARVGHYQGAQLLGRYIAEQLGGRGHVLLVGGLTLQGRPDDGRSRIAGFRDIFQTYPQISWQHLPSSWRHEVAYPQIYAALQELVAPIDAIVGLSEALALAGRDAARAQRRLEPQTLVAGLSGDIRTFAAITEGSFVATVENSVTDLGEQLVNLAHQAAQGLPLPAEFACKSQLVTAENVTKVAVQKLFAMSELPNRLVGVQRYAEKQRLRQLEISLEISRQIGSILDRWQLSDAIARLICTSYGYDQAQIFLWQEQEQRLALDQPVADPRQRVSLPLAEAGVLGQAVQRNELIFIPDTQHSSRFPPDPDWPNTRARAILPIPLGDRLLGLLDLHSKHATKHTRQELTGLQSLAAQLGIALRNADLYSQALDARAKAEAANQHLEERVQERTVDLLKANASLQQEISQRMRLEVQLRQAQKMEAIGRLAGGVAHDFNNLLTVILGYTDLMLAELAPDAPLLPEVQAIQSAGEHAAALTRQLLAFSRQQVLQPELLDLNTVVANLGQLLGRVIGEDIDLITHLGEGLGRVAVDPGQLEQVILNLAVNARDAMPQGGKLTIETARVELDADYAHQHVSVNAGPYVMLAISDTGHGMDADTQAQIFEPFFTTKEAGKGTGLGLATVHGIVHQSGGHIWLYSEPGHGTTFKIYLPQAEQQPTAARSLLPSAIVPHGSETILLVEDNLEVRKLIQRVLSNQRYTVLEASNGEEALWVAQTCPGPIDLVIMDVIMPGGLNGAQVAERLVALHPMLKVLYISGYTDNAIVRHGILETGLVFLQKPFTTDILMRKIRDVLDTIPY
jgi:signal transduction histidine kinase/CheY-like chemotaxis protein